MREVAFIRQNKEKWLGVEQVVLGKVKKNPDDLSSMYINLINDLAFAQTYYPKSKITVYLNYLSSGIFQKVYTTRRAGKNRLMHFFSTEVPLLMYQYRKYLYFSLALLAMFVFIGSISVHYDQDFVKIILGEGYVNMTLENIRKGNAVGVYQQGSTWGSAVSIIANNLKVGATLFLGGIFAGAGTFFSLMYNSIMLGAFQYFFVEQGALKDSARGIWLHGIFEIFAMVVEASAGFVLGASVLFPKTFSRMDSVKTGFRNASKIFVSTVPFTIAAGLIEGYVTRHALQMPLALNIFILTICTLSIGSYYLVYPYFVYRKLTMSL